MPAAKPVVWPFIEPSLDVWQLDPEPSGIRNRPRTTTITWSRRVAPKVRPGLFRLMLLARVQHTYPAPHNNPYGLSMGRISWDFFRRHPLD